MANINAIQKAVESARELMFTAERYLWAHPETGYREWGTQKYLTGLYESMGCKLTCAGNIPGFYMDFDTGKPGPCILIMGEMDSVICATHPECNPETGAVHACGHHAQSAALLGVASALRNENVLRGLCGKIRLMAVPAEELIEIGFREELRKKGIIKYYGGKVEFMHRGYMNGVDAAIMVHTSRGKKNSFGISKGCNGCITKNITYTGKAAHAGSSPHDGINALQAANLGISAANALRETFRDSDHIRFHPIVTSAGGAVNVIPDKVSLESYVRGASMDAFVRENRKINRALASGAAALGAQVHLVDCPGYMPLINEEGLIGITKELMEALVGLENIRITDDWGTGCTDMGDVSCVIPSIHPYASGADGTAHGADYYITDPESACVNSAVLMTAFACALLENNGAKTKYVREHAVLRFHSMKDYFTAIDDMFLDRDAVQYEDNHKTILSLG